MYVYIQNQLTPGRKYKFRKLIPHLQNINNHIPKDDLTIAWNLKGV